MAKKVLNLFVCLVLISATLTVPFLPTAQAQAVAEEKAELTGTRKQLATIIFSGLAGAILGLSTLSFYGRPQDHLSNIAIGFAVGVIGGTVFTTYKAATRPYDAYDLAMSEMETKRLHGVDVFAFDAGLAKSRFEPRLQLFQYEF